MLFSTKSLGFILIISLFSLNLAASSGIETEIEKISIITNSQVDFSLEIDKKTYFESIKFAIEGSYLSFRTLKNVELVQILNSDGQLELQIPMNNKKIHISLDDFEIGDYSINMKFHGEDTFVSSYMTKK